MSKNKNIIAAYFIPFGLKQICDIILIIASIVLLVGMFVPPVAVQIVGFALFIVGSGLAIIRLVRVLIAKTTKMNPEKRNSIINIIIMSCVFCVALFGLIYTCVTMA